MNKPVGTITWANKSTKLTEHQNTQSAPYFYDRFKLQIVFESIIFPFQKFLEYLKQPFNFIFAISLLIENKATE